jgi:hypothetical protein
MASSAECTDHTTGSQDGSSCFQGNYKNRGPADSSSVEIENHDPLPDTLLLLFDSHFHREGLTDLPQRLTRWFKISDTSARFGPGFFYLGRGCILGANSLSESREGRH